MWCGRTLAAATKFTWKTAWRLRIETAIAHQFISSTLRPNPWFGPLCITAGNSWFQCLRSQWTLSLLIPSEWGVAPRSRCPLISARGGRSKFNPHWRHILYTAQITWQIWLWFRVDGGNSHINLTREPPSEFGGSYCLAKLLGNGRAMHLRLHPLFAVMTGEAPLTLERGWGRVGKSGGEGGSPGCSYLHTTGDTGAKITCPQPTMANVQVHRASRPIVSRHCFVRFRSELWMDDGTEGELTR